MTKKLKRWRMMRLGETLRRGDQCKHGNGDWHPVIQLGYLVREAYVGLYRTRRPLPKFYAKK